MKIICLSIIIILSASLTTSQAAASLGCAHIFRSEKLEVLEANPSYTKGPQSFNVKDLNSSDVRWKGYLDETNVLSLFIALKFPGKGYRSSLQGHQLFREMMEHFGPQNIEKISDVWVDGTSFEQFFNNRKLGFSEKESALLAWEGKQASIYGFSQVESIEVYKSPLTLRNTIMVTFVRP